MCRSNSLYTLERPERFERSGDRIRRQLVQLQLVAFGTVWVFQRSRTGEIRIYGWAMNPKLATGPYWIETQV